MWLLHWSDRLSHLLMSIFIRNSKTCSHSRKSGLLLCLLHLPLSVHNPSLSRTGWRRNKNKLYTWTLLSQASIYSLWCSFYLCVLQSNSTILTTFHMPHCIPEHFLTRARDSVWLLTVPLSAHAHCTPPCSFLCCPCGPAVPLIGLF